MAQQHLFESKNEDETSDIQKQIDQLTFEKEQLFSQVQMTNHKIDEKTNKLQKLKQIQLLKQSKMAHYIPGCEVMMTDINIEKIRLWDAYYDKNSLFIVYLKDKKMIHYFHDGVRSIPYDWTRFGDSKYKMQIMYD